MGIESLYGIRVQVSPYLPSGTIMPDPADNIDYPRGFMVWSLDEKLQFLATHSRMLYISEDIAEAVRNWPN